MRTNLTDAVRALFSFSPCSSSHAALSSGSMMPYRSQSNESPERKRPSLASMLGLLSRNVVADRSGWRGWDPWMNKVDVEAWLPDVEKVAHMWWCVSSSRLLSESGSLYVSACHPRHWVFRLQRSLGRVWLRFMGADGWYFHRYLLLCTTFFEYMCIFTGSHVGYWRDKIRSTNQLKYQNTKWLAIYSALVFWRNR